MNETYNMVEKALHILLITNDFPPHFSGGISNVYFNICKNDTGKNIKVIAPFSKDAQSFDRINSLKVLRVKTPINSSLASRFLQLVIFLGATFVEMLRNNISSVWCGHVYIAPIGYLIYRLKGIPYFVFMHGGEEDVYLSKAWSRALFKRLISNASFLDRKSVV